jgi:hypothetical protein
MKKIILFVALVALISAFNLVQNVGISDKLAQCGKEKCPTQYSKCESTAGCADKIDNCANKCGEKVNQICWTGCVGITGPASALALCVANAGCLNNGFEAEKLCLEKKCFS